MHINNKIIFYGSLPPPVHGMAYVNARILNELESCDPLVINISRPAKKSITSFATKFSMALAGLFKISFITGKKITFYSSVDDGFGSILQIPILFVLRLRNAKIYLHHHSYRYLLKKRVLMFLMVLAAGSRATHVFLCEAMDQRYKALYPGHYSSMICPNPVTDPIMIRHYASPPVLKVQSTLTIGYLSNLMFEKGLREFVDLLHGAESNNYNIHAIMAGEAMCNDVKKYMDRIKYEYGSKLNYVGRVEGQRKIDFFKSIDIFVFPTLYEAETFPLVVMEALMAGCPVITTKRGCLPYFGDLSSVQIVQDDKSFIQEAYLVLRGWSISKNQLGNLKKIAYEDGIALQKKHLQAQKELIDAIRMSVN